MSVVTRHVTRRVPVMTVMSHLEETVNSLRSCFNVSKLPRSQERPILKEKNSSNEAAFKPNRVTSPREGRVTEKASRCLTSGHCLNGYETVVSGRSANAI